MCAGRSHGPEYSMWEEGVNASDPVKLFAEEGDPKLLDSESRQGYGDVLDTFTAPPVTKGVGSTSVMIALDGKHTQVSRESGTTFLSERLLLQQFSMNRPSVLFRDLTPV